MANSWLEGFRTLGLAEFKQLDLSGLYGFPLWEAEVHDLLHANFRELASIFRGYCKSLGESSSDESAKTMDLEEFHDFVIDVGLETKLQTNKAATPAVYAFDQMKEQFTRADKSGKVISALLPLLHTLPSKSSCWCHVEV